MANTDSVRVRVLTLNCWGIRYFSKHCPQRYAMIGDMLRKEEHDIVLLQEVWSERDFHSLKQKLASSHPYSHHFKSGFLGSGLVIFSKYRIHDSFLYRFSVNGYPYMAHHGDWFGGKGVGMAVLNIGGLTAKVYVTHLHAEYCRENDTYLPHRVVQTWELQQFIRHTSAGADVVILGGDLNTHPDDFGFTLLRTFTGLRDSFAETTKYDVCEGGVTLIADNPFNNKEDLGDFVKGIRIDYILFKGSSKAELYCDFMSTTKGSVPGHPFPYSDHEAVTAELRMVRHTPSETEGDRKSENQDSSAERKKLVNIITEALTEVKVGVHCAERKRYTATRTGVMGLALLFLELAIAAVPWLALGREQPFPSTSFYLLAALCFAILLTTSMLYFFYTTELKSLQGAEDQMRLAMGSLQEKLKGLPLALPPDSQRISPEGLEPHFFDSEE